jgi:hypothetical protein
LRARKVEIINKVMPTQEIEKAKLLEVLIVAVSNNYFENATINVLNTQIKRKNTRTKLAYYFFNN